MIDFNRFKNRIISHKIIPERTAKYSPFPNRLSEDLKDYLTTNGIKQLYSHQVEMFDQALDGNNLVITTSTASGKTLSFLLPVIEKILEDPSTRAIFIYPTKALASDQYRNMRPLLDFFGKNKIQAGVYDGDTPVNERRAIRNSANIILTNPEMLNSAFLPNHNKYGFNFIFSNLKYIVIDELHIYKGTFGAHIANLMKRFNRICKYYNTAPQFLCSSATIANPLELAENIVGKPFNLIDKDGSPAPEKHYYIWQPPIIASDGTRKSSTQEASDFLSELIMQDISFLSFCKSRRTVEVVLKETRDRLSYDGINSQYYANLISGYRGGYKPQERKEIEDKMINGKLKGLVSTNALELGIDIGSVQSTVLVGFPGTRASFWQQSGRAGRSGKKSATILILDYLPFDQYIGIDSEWLFSSSVENAVVDPNNLLIQLAHVRSAAAELPLSMDDLSIFPSLGEIVPVLINAGELRSENGKFSWIGSAFPAQDYSLRNMDKDRYFLYNKVNNELLTEMDELQAYREIHKGAIYLHDGALFHVEEFDLENKKAIAYPIDVNYYTVPFYSVAVTKIKDFYDENVGRTSKYFGDVNVSESVSGYKRLQFHNHRNLGFEQLAQPLVKKYETEGVRLQLPENVEQLYRSLQITEESGHILDFWKTYFGGLSFALLNATLMVTMTTKEDIGASLLKELGNDIGTSICLFDRYVGGIGYAEKAYEYIEDIITFAIKLLEGCSCEDGCPICVGDYSLDKAIVIWGLNNIWQETADPVDIKKPEVAPRVEIEKKFNFKNLENEWTLFTSFIQQTGESMSNFLAKIETVNIEDSTLILHLDSNFEKDWLYEGDNKIILENLIKYYVHTPHTFNIDTKVNSDGNLDTFNKVSRRYSDLTN